MLAALERLKHRIHSFRLPIKSPRVLLAAKTLYFFLPIVLGSLVMQLVTPDPEAMRARLGAPSAHEREVIELQKARLRETFAAAERAAAAASGSRARRD